MAFQKILKHKKKTLEFAWQHFGTLSSFWIKVKFDPMVRWRELDKINVHKVYNVHFSMAIGPHVCGSLQITNQRKMKKNTMSTYKIFSFFLR
jgi:hypothetical protein